MIAIVFNLRKRIIKKKKNFSLICSIIFVTIHSGRDINNTDNQFFMNLVNYCF